MSATNEECHLSFRHFDLRSRLSNKDRFGRLSLQCSYVDPLEKRVCADDRSACAGGFFAERSLPKRVLVGIPAKLLSGCKRVGRNGHVRRSLLGRHGLGNPCDVRRRKRVPSRRHRSNGSQCLRAGWLQRCALVHAGSIAIRRVARWQSIHRKNAASPANDHRSAIGNAPRLERRFSSYRSVWF